MRKVVALWRSTSEQRAPQAQGVKQPWRKTTRTTQTHCKDTKAAPTTPTSPAAVVSVPRQGGSSGSRLNPAEHSPQRTGCAGRPVKQKANEVDEEAPTSSRLGPKCKASSSRASFLARVMVIGKQAQFPQAPVRGPPQLQSGEASPRRGWQRGGLSTEVLVEAGAAMEYVAVKLWCFAAVATVPCADGEMAHIPQDTPAPAAHHARWRRRPSHCSLGFRLLCQNG